MPISAEDRATAKKAYSEMQMRDSSRVFSVIFGGLLLIPATLAFGVFVLDHGKPWHVWDAFVSAFHIGGILWIYLLIQVVNYLRFQARYADNLKVVTEIERKYAGELPYGLEQEIQSESRKKALLWKLDAFLSRKKSHTVI